MIDWKKIVIKKEDSLEYCIKILQDGGFRIVLIADKKNKLLGTVTDGDIRRALISGMKMTSQISDVMNKSPVTAKKTDSRKKNLSLMNELSILHLPVVTEEGVLCGLETIQLKHENSLYDNPVFLMAGGFGKRLHPLTENIPKPLLKIGNKPILETIIQQFIEYGFHNFFISTHYKSQMIKNHFKNGESHGISINYIDEDFPLGTAGSLGLLPKNLPHLPLIMMNGDLLTKVNFKDLLDFHNDSKANATMCVREYNFQVPFGVIDIDGYKIKSIKEKPNYSYFVNAGIYVLNKDIINKVDGETHIDITDLLERELDINNVNAFPIHEYWLDIGRIEEYEKANQDILNIFNKKI